VGGHVATGDSHRQARIVWPAISALSRRTKFRQLRSRNLRCVTRRSQLMHPMQFRVEQNAHNVSLR